MTHIKSHTCVAMDTQADNKILASSSSSMIAMWGQEEFFFILYIVEWGSRCVHARGHVWRPEGHSVELVLSFYT